MRKNLNSQNVTRKEHGEGSWRTLASGKINWLKTCTAKNGIKKRLSVTADSKQECRKLMKKKEEEFEAESRMDSSTKGLLADNMEKWLNTVKVKDAKCGETTYTRILSTFETHIKGSFLGNMKEDKITDKDINLFLSELKKHSPEGNVLDEELSCSSKEKVYFLLHEYFHEKYIRANELNPMLTVPKPIEKKQAKDRGSVTEMDRKNDSLEEVPLASEMM